MDEQVQEPDGLLRYSSRIYWVLRPRRSIATTVDKIAELPIPSKPSDSDRRVPRLEKATPILAKTTRAHIISVIDVKED